MKETSEIDNSPPAPQSKLRVGDLINLQEAEATLAARKTLQTAIEGIGTAMHQFRPMSDEYVKDIRQCTSAAVFEVRNLIRACEDIRKFFISEQHTEEIKRLSEFVALCERLQALKTSGFLDSVVDTILKLEVK